LQPLIDEFGEHGIRINRVIVGGEDHLLLPEVLRDIERVCNQREIRLDFVPRLVGLRETKGLGTEILDTGVVSPPVKIALPSYFHIKRIVDLLAALVIVVLLLPILVLVAGLVLLDVGSPVLFWQQRIGAGGTTFLLQKFRTLRPPFDWNAQPVPDEQRLSWIGRILRTTRLDELPQLLNVMVGDMSIVGPRPLLPRDQPPNPGVRLIVRPGITGWAQVNGGNLLTPGEKDQLDEWYIRNASLLLDLRIICMTFVFLFRGEQRSELALADARSVRDGEDRDWRDYPTARPSP
jgi:lipopolysaccharide/colanic/teichoic acid biosynthesis glycosyltransferase